MRLRVSPSLLNQFSKAKQAPPDEAPAAWEKLFAYIRRESKPSTWGTLGTDFHKCMSDPVGTAILEDGEVTAWNHRTSFFPRPFMLECLAHGWHPDMVFDVWGSRTVELEPGLEVRVIGLTDACWDNGIIDWKMVSFEDYREFSASFQHRVYMWLLGAGWFWYILYPYRLVKGVPVLTEPPFRYKFFPQPDDGEAITNAIKELVAFARAHDLLDYLIDRPREK